MENSKQPINPIAGSHQPLHPMQLIGLTKREYFAVMAMQGWIACQHEGFTGDAKEVAKRAVDCADALLKELEK